MVRQGRRRVVRSVLVERDGMGTGGFMVYITQCDGRGVTFLMSTRIMCIGGSVSKSVTASLAVASASKVIAPDVRMCPEFVKVCAEAYRPFGLKEVRYAS
jgi:hypothetical protein